MALTVTSAAWQQVNMPAIDLRRYLSFGMSEGVSSSADMTVAQRAAGANMTVDIAAGEALVQGDTVTNQGRYYVLNDAVFNLTGFAAAHATLPRIDRVTLRYRDAFHGDAANDVSYQIVTGTATSGATLANLNGAAAVPGSQLLLANVLIPAASTSITTANIDTTVRVIAGFGGQVALTSLQQGGATTGQLLRWSGTAWAANTIDDRGITLPGSPVDMQEYTLVDSLTASTYHWRFRYSTASTNADKWEFVGGTPMYAEVMTAEATSSTTYVALTTAGPSLTVPRAGVYDVEVGFRKTGTSTQAAIMSYDIGGTGAADADSIAAGDPVGSGSSSGGNAAKSRRKSGLAASTALVSKYKAGTATSTQFQDRYMRVTPIRVS